MQTKKLFTVISFVSLAVCSRAPLANAQGECLAKSTPGWLTSWTGQPGLPDNAAEGALPKNTRLACRALAAPGSIPACFLTLDGGGQVRLKNNAAYRLKADDTVTLTCNGTAPMCCKVQIIKPTSVALPAKPQP
jgi:hypothetical protein